jgi:hypothetical protein
MSDSDQHVGGQPLTQCPMCAYSLTGLPENHVCPECGFDVGSILYHWKTPPMRWPIVLVGGYGSIATVAALLLSSTITPNDTKMLLFVTGIWSISWFGIFALLGRVRTFLVVTRDGITFCRALGHVRSWLWEELCVPADNGPIYRFVNGVPRHALLPQTFTERTLRQTMNRAIASEWRERMTVKETCEPRLVYCPVCGYDLRSLPETHRCPECGFHYDPMTIVEWDFVSGSLFSAFGALVAALSTLPMTVGTLVRRSGFTDVLQLVALSAQLGMVVLIVHLVRRARVQRSFLALGRHGITLRGTFQRTRTIEWERIDVTSWAPLVVNERTDDELVNLRIPLLFQADRAAVRSRIKDEFHARWWKAHEEAEDAGGKSQ